MEEVSYLGFKINKNGLTKTTERVEAILKAPMPTNVSKVLSFIGLMNYYSKFIHNYTKLIIPFYELLKSEKIDWNDRCKNSYELAKNKMLEDVTLSHFNADIPIILTCDAS